MAPHLNYGKLLLWMRCKKIFSNRDWRSPGVNYSQHFTDGEVRINRWCLKCSDIDYEGSKVLLCSPIPHIPHTQLQILTINRPCLKTLSRPPWLNSTQKPHRKVAVEGSGEYFCRRSVNWLSLGKGPMRGTGTWFKVENGSGQLGADKKGNPIPPFLPH